MTIGCHFIALITPQVGVVQIIVCRKISLFLRRLG